uniref:Uncharacterized protein n=1 Tax=Arundo donax TaxID=35708 RepID=A0A0A9FUN3_ARUDO
MLRFYYLLLSNDRLIIEGMRLQLKTS